MDNFTFYNPTRLEFGSDVIMNLGTEVRKIGTRILLVYGKGSIKKNFVYEQVIDSLTSHHIEIYEHNGVSGNPLLSHAREGIKKAKEFQVDLIVAVGGGSVIDEAKVIAAGACMNCDVWDLFTKKEPVTIALPIVSVLTLPATGSEMNGFTVLTNDETKDKFALSGSPVLNPRISFLDPRATFSVPLKQTAYACADIISHMTEGYFTTSVSTLYLQDNLIKGLFASVTEAMSAIMKDPEDYDARAAFMWSATLAWNGIAQVGIPSLALPCHALEMPLSGVYNIAHGAGLSIITPQWLLFAEDTHKERICSFGRDFLNLKNATVESTAEALKALYVRIGAPTSFADLKIDPDLDLLTEMAFASFAQRGVSGYTKETIRKIYTDSL